MDNPFSIDHSAPANFDTLLGSDDRLAQWDPFDSESKFRIPYEIDPNQMSDLPRRQSSSDLLLTSIDSQPNSQTPDLSAKPIEILWPTHNTGLNGDLEIAGSASTVNSMTWSVASELSSRMQTTVTSGGKRYICSYCGGSFGNRADLRRHHREKHERRADLESRHRCPDPECARHRQGFTRRWNLLDHWQRRHGGDMPKLAVEEHEAMAKEPNDAVYGLHPRAEHLLLEEPEIMGPPPPAATSRVDIRSVIRSELDKTREERDLLDLRREVLSKEVERLERALAALDPTDEYENQEAAESSRFPDTRMSGHGDG